jgi:hypothetical protein
MINLIRETVRRMFGVKGIHFISSANTITGNFYGIAAGSTLPDSLKVIPTNKNYINGVLITSATELVNFVNAGEFVPIRCSSVTTTGSGYVKAYMD